jgi:hypothetical protein
MKVFWWQAGLHIQPEDKKEAELLVGFVESLKFVDINQGVPTGPIDGIKLSDQ